MEHGMHIIRKKLPAGDRYYVYAWRGGPCIHKQDHNYPVITPRLISLQQKEIDKTRKRASGETFEKIITAYRASPQFIEGLKDNTQRNYRLWMDRISAQFGKAPIEAFNNRLMRKDVLAWRDSYRDTPRTADQGVTFLNILLSWAVDHAMLQINVASRIKQINKTNKADEIWEPEHWEQFRAVDPPKHLWDALILASLTGLRLGDLVRVTWADVYPNAIKIARTGKRGGRAVIPILPELRQWLDSRNDREGTLLVNSRLFPWTDSGLGSVFQKKKPEGFDRTIHDLRGTFATRLIIAGLTDEQAAMVLGWTAKRIAAVRSRYVDEERVILSIADKINAA